VASVISNRKEIGLVVFRKKCVLMFKITDIEN
jgi:hypothetical protein